MYRDISGPATSPIGLLLLQPIRTLRDGGISPRARARACQPARQSSPPESVSRTAIKHRDVSFVARDRARLINSSRRTRAESACPHFVARGYAIPPSIVYSFAGYHAISAADGHMEGRGFVFLTRLKIRLNHRERDLPISKGGIVFFGRNENDISAIDGFIKRKMIR